MYQIQNLGANAIQQQRLVLPNGTLLSLTVSYFPQQYGWFITNMVYGSIILNGIRITNSPNMLYQFKNTLPFGLACFSTQGREPTQIGDFQSGEASLYILTAAEVLEYEAYLGGGSL